MRRHARPFAVFVVTHSAELLTAAAALLGWALVTWGIALYLGWRVWPISLGLFSLSCVGWRFLFTLASAGLYSLTRPE